MSRILDELVERYRELADCRDDIQAAFELVEQSYRAGGKLLVCGNGGSAADSEHIVGELMKGYLRRRAIGDDLRKKLQEAAPVDGTYLADRLQGALPAISLVSQTSLLTAVANDVAGDMIFAQQVYGYGAAGDCLLGISTSGNARNVIHALQVGRALGLHTIGLTGRPGGDLKRFCDVAICVPWEDTVMIQERHRPVYHALCAMIEEAFFAE